MVNNISDRDTSLSKAVIPRHSCEKRHPALLAQIDSEPRSQPLNFTRKGLLPVVYQQVMISQLLANLFQIIGKAHAAMISLVVS